jgi:hypothetical protein
VPKSKLFTIRSRPGRRCCIERSCAVLHGVSDKLAPFFVVRCFLVRSGGVLVMINLDEHEPGRVVALLHDIEASDASLLDAVLRILGRRVPKRVDAFRLHAHMDMNDEHRLFRVLILTREK